MEQKELNLDSWNDFAGEYIKAENIKEFPAKLVVIGVRSEVKDKKPRLYAEVEYNERTWTFDLNKTNQNVVKDHKLMPKEMIGKVFTVITVKVTNPTTKGLVDSLVISNIE